MALLLRGGEPARPPAWESGLVFIHLKRSLAVQRFSRLFASLGELPSGLVTAVVFGGRPDMGSSEVDEQAQRRCRDGVMQTFGTPRLRLVQRCGYAVRSVA